MVAVILAGGAGTRMGNLCAEIPKPMVEICGKPILQHQVEALKKEGINDFVFVVGHLSQVIENYFSDGENLGVNISYYRETSPLGTGGALTKLNLNEDFLLCNGDLIFDFSLQKMLGFHKEKRALITALAHPNSHPYDSDLLETDDNFCVTQIISKANRNKDYANLCNAGIHIVSPLAIPKMSEEAKLDFNKDIVNPLIKQGGVFAYKSAEYVKDMGTPERLEQVDRDMSQGIVAAKNITNRQKAVFLDRDGTINIHKGFITSADKIELIAGAAQAINKFHSLGYLAIIVTNQPVIARGECSKEELKNIHNRLEALLGKDGAYVDAIYCCPHHPDKGFPGERAELKFDCDCRKPKPGMILKAQKDFNIDLKKSYMVGDSERDILAAKNAGCTAVYIGEQEYGGNVLSFTSLYEFSEQLEETVEL